MLYGLLVTYLENLLVCERKELRVGLTLKWNAYTHLIMSDINILNNVDTNILQIDCYMYKTMNNLLSTHLSNYFVIYNVLQDHYTRQSDNLHVISHPTQAKAN